MESNSNNNVYRVEDDKVRCLNCSDDADDSKMITRITQLPLLRMVGVSIITDILIGHVTTENRTVQGEFKSIEVSNAIDLIIEQSNKTEIIVTADDNLQKNITTTVKMAYLLYPVIIIPL
jgi:hypothetical protein